MTPTPSQLEYHRQHLARIARISARAVPDAGISLPRPAPCAPWRAGDDIAAHAETAEPTPTPQPRPQPRPHRKRQPPQPPAELPPRPRPPTLAQAFGTGVPHTADVIRAVSTATGISDDDILGHRRQKPFSRPRHMAVWLTIQVMGLSYPRTGRMFGGRDHTTMLHSWRWTENHMDEVRPILEFAVAVLREAGFDVPDLSKLITRGKLGYPARTPHYGYAKTEEVVSSWITNTSRERTAPQTRQYRRRPRLTPIWLRAMRGMPSTRRIMPQNC